MLSMTQRGDDRSWYIKSTHTEKVSTSQYVIFHGEHALEVFDEFHRFLFSGALSEKSRFLRRKNGNSRENHK